MNKPTGETSHLTEVPPKLHLLPPLNYDYAALEPCIDARTMMLHHNLHHGGYVDKLNAALEQIPEFREASALWLLRNLEKLPEGVRDAVHHNAGGHVNHSMFWRAMKPGVAGQPAPKPKGALSDAIVRDFGSFDEFKKKFEQAGAQFFGSGWVWLTRTRGNDGKLEVITTSGHDHPMMQGRYPLLLNDLWEHACYLRYENRRIDYLKAWWSLADWEVAARCFDHSDKAAEDVWEEEGGLLGKQQK